MKKWFKFFLWIIVSLFSFSWTIIPIVQSNIWKEQTSVSKSPLDNDRSKKNSDEINNIIDNWPQYLLTIGGGVRTFVWLWKHDGYFLMSVTMFMLYNNYFKKQGQSSDYSYIDSWTFFDNKLGFVNYNFVIANANTSFIDQEGDSSIYHSIWNNWIKCEFNIQYVINIIGPIISGFFLNKMTIDKKRSKHIWSIWALTSTHLLNWWLMPNFSLILKVDTNVFPSFIKNYIRGKSNIYFYFPQIILLLIYAKWLSIGKIIVLALSVLELDFVIDQSTNLKKLIKRCYDLRDMFVQFLKDNLVSPVATLFLH